MRRRSAHTNGSKGLDRARQRQATDAARAARLNLLATRKEAAWAEVEQWIATKQPKHYDLAVATLRDLRALANRDGDQAACQARVEGLRTRHARKPIFLERLERAGLH